MSTADSTSEPLLSCRYCGNTFDPTAKPEMCTEAPVSVLYHAADGERFRNGGGTSPGAPSEVAAWLLKEAEEADRVRDEIPPGSTRPPVRAVAAAERYAKRCRGRAAELLNPTD